MHAHDMSLEVDLLRGPIGTVVARVGLFFGVHEDVPPDVARIGGRVAAHWARENLHAGVVENLRGDFRVSVTFVCSVVVSFRIGIPRYLVFRICCHCCIVIERGGVFRCYG